MLRITRGLRAFKSKQEPWLFSAGGAVSLENKGFALTWSAVRFAYAMGGDGQADMRIDIRRIAAFVRDPAACVTCLLLPLSCSAHLQISVSSSCGEGRTCLIAALLKI